jgi:hypothetical protein
VTLEAIFVPFGKTSVHPFTGVPASGAGRESIRDNGVEIESELKRSLVRHWPEEHAPKIPILIQDHFAETLATSGRRLEIGMIRFSILGAFHPEERSCRLREIRRPMQAENLAPRAAAGLDRGTPG